MTRVVDRVHGEAGPDQRLGDVRVAARMLGKPVRDQHDRARIAARPPRLPVQPAVELAVFVLHQSWSSASRKRMRTSATCSSMVSGFQPSVLTGASTETPTVAG